MKIRQLHYLLAIAEELSFTAAAARCNVSQPPLSRAIRDLEQEVGAQLVNRNTHSVSLTPAGEFLARDAARALALLDDAARQSRRLATGLRGTVRVGFGGSTVYSLLPALIRRARSHLPDVAIEFVAMPVLDQIEALRAGEIDVGVLRTPVHDELIETRFVHREQLVVAMPATHPLAGSGDDVVLASLAPDRFVTYQQRRGFNYHVDLLALCHLSGFAPAVAHEAATTEAVVGIVACGEGVALVPASAARLAMDGVVFRNVAGADGAAAPMVEFALAWHRDRRSQLTDEFIRVAHPD